MKNTLRLLLFDDCNRSCEGCCNKGFDLKKLPIETDFSGYEMIILTGGEPMLKPDIVLSTIDKIRKQNKTAKIFMYTAKVDNIMDCLFVISALDGVTITLHEQKDVIPFIYFSKHFKENYDGKRSFRLNVFKGINALDIIFNEKITDKWTIKKNIEWIKDCPLPSNEVFKKL